MANQGNSNNTANERWALALKFLKTWTPRWLQRKLQPSNANSGSIIAMHNVGHAPAVAPEDADTTHLLLCIDNGDLETRLHQKRVETYTTDRELFAFIRQEYYRKPNSWFTLRSINLLSLSRFTVDLSTFAEVHRHTSVCSPNCVCLPPAERVGPEYACTPAPGTPPKYFPPIGPRRMTHYFRKPGCIDASQTTVYDQLPKRLCGELKASSKQEEVGWGVHIQEGWHWHTIYVITVVFLSLFSLVFGIVWSVTKSDIQGGFAVSGVCLTLASVLLGHLAVRRE